MLERLWLNHSDRRSSSGGISHLGLAKDISATLIKRKRLPKETIAMLKNFQKMLKRAKEIAIVSD